MIFNRNILFAFCLLGVTVCGCSGGAASTAPVDVSAADRAKSNVSRANLMLDNLEKLPAEQRDTVANVPRTADTLKKASSDASVKQRIDSLGIHLK